jgi:zinc transport system substrate-binding protein
MSQVRCVFSEPQFEPALVTTLIENTGAKHAELDPLGIALTPGPDAYFQLLRNLAQALRDCLQ